MMQFISWILALSMTLSGCASLPQSRVADTSQLPENQKIQTAQTSESTVPVKTGFTTEKILDGADGAIHYSYYLPEGDEYYGSQKARDAYSGLHDAYQETGLTEEQIRELLKLENPDNEHFNRLGIYNYHSGGNILFDDERILNWMIQKEKQVKE